MSAAEDAPDPSVAMIACAGAAALAADGPEAALAGIIAEFHVTLGDRSAHEQPGALLEGESQFFVAGAFLVTPDRAHHMLVGSHGFPPEQRRLMIPIDAGHPGWVFENQNKLLLRNTDDHGNFKQYLRTSRMGSSIYAPMIWRGKFVGQLVMAAQARWTMRERDLAALEALAGLATVAWMAHGGPDWLESEYPPKDADRVSGDGLS